jgi:hypothetical protein
MKNASHCKGTSFISTSIYLIISEKNYFEPYQYGSAKWRFTVHKEANLTLFYHLTQRPPGQIFIARKFDMESTIAINIKNEFKRLSI